MTNEELKTKSFTDLMAMYRSEYTSKELRDQIAEVIIDKQMNYIKQCADDYTVYKQDHEDLIHVGIVAVLEVLASNKREYKNYTSLFRSKIMNAIQEYSENNQYNEDIDEYENILIDYDMERNLYRRLASEVIYKALQRYLSARQFRVIDLAFGFNKEKLSIRKISNLMGCSNENIRQIEVKSLRKLRNPIRRKSYIDFCEDFDIYIDLGRKSKTKRKENFNMNIFARCNYNVKVLYDFFKTFNVILFPYYYTELEWINGNRKTTPEKDHNYIREFLRYNSIDISMTYPEFYHVDIDSKPINIGYDDGRISISLGDKPFSRKIIAEIYSDNDKFIIDIKPRIKFSIVCTYNKRDNIYINTGSVFDLNKNVSRVFEFSMPSSEPINYDSPVYNDIFNKMIEYYEENIELSDKCYLC